MAKLIKKPMQTALAFFNYLTGSILYLTEKQDFHSPSHVIIPVAYFQTDHGVYIQNEVSLTIFL